MKGRVALGGSLIALRPSQIYFLLRGFAVAQTEIDEALVGQKKSVFFFGVVRVVDEPCVLVCEDSLSVLEAHPIHAQVRSRFLGVSFDSEHLCGALTLYTSCKRAGKGDCMIWNLTPIL